MDKKVNLQEFIQRIADRIEIPGIDAERFVQSLFEIVEENLLADKVVRIKGIGTFKLLEVNARTSVDVNTKERIEIKEHFRVTFTPDAVLKDKVNKPFAGFTSVMLDECNVDTGVLENTEEDPLTDEQLTAYETAAKPNVPELNVHVDIPTGDSVEVHHHPVVEVPSSDESTIKSDDVVTVTDEPLQAPSSSLTETETESEVESKVEAEVKVEAESEVEIETKSESGVESEAEVEYEAEDGVDPEVEPTPQEPKEEPLNTKNMKPNEENSGSNSTTRIILIILLVLLIAACGMMGYFAYKLYHPITPEQETPDSIVGSKNTQAVPTEESDSLQASKEEDNTDADTLVDNYGDGTIDPQMRAEIMKQELSSYYPQMEGAEYLIIGTADTIEVKPGISLTKLAKTYFGSGDFVTYIKFYNRIDNPDLLRTGQKLLIPLLTKK
jgi:nucleoid DNA-binding protein/flagellar basal body-associated protein FliL